MYVNVLYIIEHQPSIAEVISPEQDIYRPLWQGRIWDTPNWYGSQSQTYHRED